jgi:hypothetical protein
MKWGKIEAPAPACCLEGSHERELLASVEALQPSPAGSARCLLDDRAYPKQA